MATVPVNAINPIATRLIENVALSKTLHTPMNTATNENNTPAQPTSSRAPAEGFAEV